MCEWNNLSLVKLCQPKEVSGREVVPVDSCIASLVQRLNDIGLHTLGSCCGHNKRGLSVIIEIEGKVYEVKQYEPK